jgi:hypothetical protein
MAMPEQLPQISILRTGYPDPRKVIFPQQPEQELGISAVGLLLLDSLGYDLCGILRSIPRNPTLPAAARTNVNTR